MFLLAFGAVLFLTTSFGKDGFDAGDGLLTTVAFVLGGLTSMACGWIGMAVATTANSQCALAAAVPPRDRWRAAFNRAFRAGGD